MFDNLMIVAVVAGILWLGLFIFYLISSNQQRDIEADIQKLQQLLDSEDEEQASGGHE